MKYYSLFIIAVLISPSLYSMETPCDVPSNSNGQTKIHLELVRLSEQGGELSLLKSLLEEDPRLANIEDRKGKTPVDYALNKGAEWESVVELLKEYGGTATTGEASENEFAPIKTNSIAPSNIELTKKLLAFMNAEDMENLITEIFSED